MGLVTYERKLRIAIALACLVAAACSAGNEAPSLPTTPSAPAPNIALAFPDDPIGHIDEPDECARINGNRLNVSGWAIDRNAKAGTGVDNVSIYLDGGPDSGIPLGIADYGRPHVSGPDAGGDARFLPSGWQQTLSLSGGGVSHTLNVVAHSSVTGRTKLLTRTIGRVHSCNNQPIGDLNAPAEGAALTGGATDLQGWAADRDSLSGSGVASVDLYLDGCPGAGTELGHARLGQPSAELADWFSTSELGSAGWSFRWRTNGLSAGPHTIYALVRSAVHARTTTLVRTYGGPPMGIVGCFDETTGGDTSPDEVDLSGWAIDRGNDQGANRSGIASVTLWLEDGPEKPALLGTARLGGQRSELYTLWPANETSGWTFAWDTTGVEPGRHALKAVVATTAGKTTTYQRSIDLAPLYGRNVARGHVASASRTWTVSPAAAALAFDGDLSTAWGSGDYAPQWIDVDLGASIAIARIRLVALQSPPGHTVHRILGRSADGSYRELTRFDGVTSDGQAMEWSPTASVSGIRFVRVETLESPSWVGWREIEIYLGPPASPKMTRVIGKLVLASGAPAADICVQIGGAAACVTQTDANGTFFYDFDTVAVATADWTFSYKVDGVVKGSQSLSKGAAASNPYALPVYALQP